MDGQHRISLPLARFNRRKESATLKGPLRVFRLCLLSILLPGLLIAGPLYLRYRVFSEQVYPLGMSDMRIVDSKISTTWCQKQLVLSNATFNAYLLPEEPEIKPNPVQVSTVKYLTLEDDMKEYWGFYLLKGSSVTVSTCCRWPGASLIVIKGHRHLRECAYIGDDSSEELEELEELNKRTERNDKQKARGKPNSRNDQWPLKKARPSIEFFTSLETDTTESGSNREFIKNSLDARKTGTPATNINEADKESGQRDATNVGTILNREEDTRNSEEVYEGIMNKIASLGSRRSSFMSRLKKTFMTGDKDIAPKGDNGNATKEIKTVEAGKSKTQKREISLWSLERELNREDDASDVAEEEGLTPREDIRGTVNGTTANDMSNSEFWSSFSSSEERLLSCAGLILNLPLAPSKDCHPSESEGTQAKASLTNKLTYKVPSNGYYFFVFSSENEIQPNYIRIHFHLEKILYNVSNPLVACTNTTESCSLPLNFFSREKVVLEMPINANGSLWNQEYVVVSVCEPRTMVYAACVIAVPILILLFAF